MNLKKNTYAILKIHYDIPYYIRPNDAFKTMTKHSIMQTYTINKLCINTISKSHLIPQKKKPHNSFFSIQNPFLSQNSYNKTRTQTKSLPIQSDRTAQHKHDTNQETSVHTHIRRILAIVSSVL